MRILSAMHHEAIVNIADPLHAIMIQLPFKFPSEQAKLAKEAEEFRRLNSTERFLRIFALSGFCERLLEQSPQREAILAQRLASEKEWQRIHQELFERHGV